MEDKKGKKMIDLDKWCIKKNKQDNRELYLDKNTGIRKDRCLKIKEIEKNIHVNRKM